MTTKIAVVGTGYVGLSMAVLLAQHNEVVGFDIDARRVLVDPSGLQLLDRVVLDVVVGLSRSVVISCHFEGYSLLSFSGSKKIWVARPWMHRTLCAV